MTPATAVRASQVRGTAPRARRFGGWKLGIAREARTLRRKRDWWWGLGEGGWAVCTFPAAEFLRDSTRRTATGPGSRAAAAPRTHKLYFSAGSFRVNELTPRLKLTICNVSRPRRRALKRLMR